MKHVTRHTIKPKFIAVVLLTICTAVALIYFGRGWIRVSVLPFYARVVYLPHIEKHFDANLKGVNLTLAKIGYHFDSQSDDLCMNPSFQGFGESIFCVKGATSNKLLPSVALTNKWKEEAPGLERQILQSGWTKDDVNQPILTLLDDTDVTDTSQPAVTYRMSRGRVECYLSIRNSPSSRETYATEECHRDVGFFGGY